MSSLANQENVAGGDILVIEDSPTQADRLRHILEKNHFHVRVARDGREALAMVHDRKPELAITDIMMPEMDGFELCRKIKGDERLRDIPVIILTSLADPRDVIKGLECGADSFVTKPIGEEYLLARIAHIRSERGKPRCVSIPQEMEVTVAGQSYTINSDRRQIFDLFLSTYEAAFQKNRELRQALDKLHEANARLESTNKELDAANRELETFGYTVSHDLRKPLSIISGYGQVLSEICAAQLDDQCKEYLKEITKRTYNMGDLIDALLNFSKLKHVKPTREQVDLSNMANVIAGELRMTEPHRRVTFTITEGVTVSGDTRLIWLVLENLLGNAWKYTANREEAFIEFGQTTTGGETVFFVRDNGAGFDMAHADKIFEPFERLDEHRGFKGHGIGLSTVKRIIQHHDGRIWAEGERGKGATFYFTL
jgi:two-component system, sensor histidine kinase and response regulator